MMSGENWWKKQGKIKTSEFFSLPMYFASELFQLFTFFSKEVFLFSLFFTFPLAFSF